MSPTRTNLILSSRGPGAAIATPLTRTPRRSSGCRQAWFSNANAQPATAKPRVRHRRPSAIAQVDLHRPHHISGRNVAFPPFIPINCRWERERTSDALRPESRVSDGSFVIIASMLGPTALKASPLQPHQTRPSGSSSSSSKPSQISRCSPMKKTPSQSIPTVSVLSCSKAVTKTCVSLALLRTKV